MLRTKGFRHLFKNWKQFPFSELIEQIFCLKSVILISTKDGTLYGYNVVNQRDHKFLNSESKSKKLHKYRSKKNIIFF